MNGSSAPEARIKLSAPCGSRRSPAKMKPMRYLTVKWFIIFGGIALLGFIVTWTWNWGTPINTLVVARNFPWSISVIDGDTIRISGAVYRLIGFDTPEAGG
jgi:hypothetical protein